MTKAAKEKTAYVCTSGNLGSHCDYLSDEVNESGEEVGTRVRGLLSPGMAGKSNYALHHAKP
jgi:hypothetical protein